MIHRLSTMLALLVLLVACGAAPAGESLTAPAGETHTITDARGTQIVVPVAPQRVVTLTEHDLDSALALDITPVGSVNGRGQAGLPAYLADHTAGVASVGSLAEPSLEAIVALGPDLILAGNLIAPIEALLPELQQIAPVVQTYNAGDDWQTAFAGTAAALNRSAAAEAFLADYNERAAAIRATLPTDQTSEASVVRWMPQGPVVMVPSTFSSLVLADLGLARPAGHADLAGGHGAHSDPLSLEQLDLIDTDWLFIGSLNAEGDAALETARANPLFQQLEVVKQNQIAVVDGAVWTSIGGPLAALVVLDDVEAALAGGVTAGAASADSFSCAAGLRPFVHSAGETCVPAEPQRIVTIQDQNALLPLLELGVRPVGSAGQPLADGDFRFRRTADFDTTGIEFVGNYWGEANAEAIAALQPDLIVGDAFAVDFYDLHSQIAPTVLIDVHEQPLDQALMDFATLVGRTEQAAALRDAYQTRIADLLAELGERKERLSVSVITAGEAGEFYRADTGQALGTVMQDLDLLRPAPQQATDSYDAFSLETLPAHDADVVLVINFAGEDQDPSFDAFITGPIFQALGAAGAGQTYVIDGTQTVGAGWSKMGAFLDQLETILLDPDLNLDVVQETGMR